MERSGISAHRRDMRNADIAQQVSDIRKAADTDKLAEILLESKGGNKNV